MNRIPDEIIEKAKTYLPNAMIETILNFERVISDQESSSDIRNVL